MSALTGCAYLGLRPAAAPGRAGVGQLTCERPSAASFFLGLSSEDAQEVRSVELDHLLAELDAATSLQQRCLALTRVAYSPELDRHGVERIIAYTARDRDVDTRMCALNALAEVQDESALAAIVALTTDTMLYDAPFRALGQRHDEASRNALRTLVRDGTQLRRVWAAMALSASGAPDAVDVIVGLLPSASTNERYQLISALGANHDPKTVGTLRGLIDRSSRNEQWAIISALGEVGGPSATSALLEVIREQPGLAAPAVQALARVNDETARRELIALANDKTSTVIADGAFMALAAQSSDEVRALMRGALRGSSQNRLNTAIEYFATHPDDEASSVLIELAESGSPRTVQMAVSALGRMGGDEAHDALLDLASSGSGAASSAALGALAMHPDGAREAFDLALDSVREGGRAPDPNLISVLANDDRPETLAVLRGLARRNDGPGAQQALMLLAQRPDAQNVALLKEFALSGKSSEQRMMALGALAQSGDKAALGVMEEALRSSKGMERGQAAMHMVELGGQGAERALLDATRDAQKDPEFMVQASAALAQVGTPAALARLEQVAREANPTSAGPALNALAMSSPERAASVAEQLSRSDDVSVRMGVLNSLGALPEATAQRIVSAALRDADPQLVNQALDTAGWIGAGGEPGRAALRDLAEHSQEEAVRARAAALLANMPMGLVRG